MTVVSTSVPCPRPSAQARVRPAGVNRLALVVGLALVSWGRRSSNRPTLTHEEVHIRRLAEREGELLRADLGAARHPYGSIR